MEIPVVRDRWEFFRQAFPVMFEDPLERRKKTDKSDEFSVAIGSWLSHWFLNKLGCVVRMVIDSILPHAESGPNDQRKDAPRLLISRVN